jgi:hypothetical protein
MSEERSCNNCANLEDDDCFTECYGDNDAWISKENMPVRSEPKKIEPLDLDMKSPVNWIISHIEDKINEIIAKINNDQ